MSDARFTRAPNGCLDPVYLDCWYCNGRDGDGEPFNPEVHSGWSCEACTDRYRAFEAGAKQERERVLAAVVAVRALGDDEPSGADEDWGHGWSGALDELEDRINYPALTAAPLEVRPPPLAHGAGPSLDPKHSSADGEPSGPPMGVVEVKPPECECPTDNGCNGPPCPRGIWDDSRKAEGDGASLSTPEEP